jgi:hypothetical protein
MSVGPWIAPIVSSLVVLAITVFLWKSQKKREIVLKKETELLKKQAELLQKQFDALSYETPGPLGPIGAGDMSRKQQDEIASKIPVFH